MPSGHIAVAESIAAERAVAGELGGLWAGHPGATAYVRLPAPGRAFAVGLVTGEPLRIRDLGPAARPEAGSLCLVVLQPGEKPWPAVRALLAGAPDVAPRFLSRKGATIVLEMVKRSRQRPAPAERGAGGQRTME
jgi:hypothetical protein